VDGRGLVAKSIDGAVFAAWLAAYAVLLATGAYTDFLRPALWPILVGAGTMLAAFLATLALRQRPAPRDGWLARLVRAGLLLLPLAYLLAARGEILGSYAYGKRALAGGGLSATGRPLATTAAVPDDEPTAALDLDQIWEGGQRLCGRRVVTEGMVFLDASVPEGFFVLFRFVMICCAADVQPIGVYVRHADAAKMEPDAWACVTGRIGTMEVAGEEVPALDAEKVETIPRPGNPYLYP